MSQCQIKMVSSADCPSGIDNARNSWEILKEKIKEICPVNYAAIIRNIENQYGITPYDGNVAWCENWVVAVNAVIIAWNQNRLNIIDCQSLLKALLPWGLQP